MYCYAEISAYVCKGLSFNDLRKIAAASIHTERYVRKDDKSDLLDKYNKVPKE